MKDDSFINLIYFLSIEKNTSYNINSVINKKQKTSSDILNNQNKLNDKNNIKSNINNENNNLDIKKRITKKLISRKN